MQKGTFLIENTEGKFALEHKETGRAPRQLRWRGFWGTTANVLDAVDQCGEFLGLLAFKYLQLYPGEV
jgi:hypothetical protein